MTIGNEKLGKYCAVPCYLDRVSATTFCFPMMWMYLSSISYNAATYQIFLTNAAMKVSLVFLVSENLYDCFVITFDQHFVSMPMRTEDPES